MTPAAEACEACGRALRPLYPVALGAEGSTLHRCGGCGTCVVRPAFPEDRVRAYYEGEYFSGEDWQVRKSRVLAADYLRKLRGAGFRVVPGGRYLEVGAGYGHFARRLARRAAVDVVEPGRDCRAYIRRHGGEVRQVAASVADLAADRGYDAVFAFHVLEHLQTLGPFLDAVAGLLRPGGMFWALTPNACSAGFVRLGADWGWACPTQHYQFVSPRAPAGFYAGHGFRPVVVRDVQPHPIHYPGRWHPALWAAHRWLTRRGPVGVAVRKPLVALTWLVQPNRAANLLPVGAERAVARAVDARPFDELLLGLRRDGPAHAHR